MSRSRRWAAVRQCIYRQHFATRAEARPKTAIWITDFYNTRRRHSAANGLPPTEFGWIISEARASRLYEGLAA
ncbi:integrase core domain-containing protein [Kitasatospora sp. NPDC056138]|uniref:integrase core domain-containing protein n=1 Tax=Kitasatospora sp. NPDC056138 TaxID=3345724 RepID=UPI0035D88D77